MSKLLKIIVSVVGLSLFYLWMSSVFQSCGNKNQDKTEEASLMDDIATDEEIIDVSDEDFFEDDLADGESIGSGEESFEELEDELVSDSQEENTYSPPSYTSSNSNTGSSGAYLLISGNYLVQSNADEMQKKLHKLGYSNAEIVIFDRSQYHTVIASRFSSYDTALQSASMLKQKGVDCYVKKRS